MRPPLDLPGPTFSIPKPPIFIPDKGMYDMEKVVETAFPSLELKDEIYAQSILEFILEAINLDKSVLDDPT